MYRVNWNLTSALGLPVAYGGVDEGADRRAVAMAFAALLAEPCPRQGAQTGRVCLCLLEDPAALTQGQVEQQTNTTSYQEISAYVTN